MTAEHFDVLIIGASLSGVGSDSDMYTLGYSFRPWEQPKAIADGSSILK